MEIKTDGDDVECVVISLIIVGLCFIGFLVYRYNTAFLEQGYVQIISTQTNSAPTLLWTRPTPQ